MKVVHLASFDVLGGAAKAAYRMHRALVDAGASSTMLVHRKLSDDPTVVELRRGPFAELPQLFDRAAIWSLGYRRRAFRTPAILGRRFQPALDALAPDVVHLHWLQQGFVRPEALAHIGRPLVWSLHDTWPFGGAQHYEGREPDAGLDRWVTRRKARAYSAIDNLTVLAPSRWMGDCARKSALLGARPVEVIPYAVDLERFRPRPQDEARRALGLPAEGRVVLFNAMDLGDERKGLRPLLDALAQMPAQPVLALAGRGGPARIDVPHLRLGPLAEERVALACAAADVLACPSLHENLPNTAIEALACGTPIVAFDTGGLPDIVTHARTGWLAPAGDAAGLRAGLEWVFAQGPGVRAEARASAEERFAPARIAARLQDLYRRVIARSPLL